MSFSLCHFVHLSTLTPPCPALSKTLNTILFFFFLNYYSYLAYTNGSKQDVEQMDNGTSYRGGMCVEV